jgi:hypothetical protein
LLAACLLISHLLEHVILKGRPACLVGRDEERDNAPPVTTGDSKGKFVSCEQNVEVGVAIVGERVCLYHTLDAGSEFNLFLAMSDRFHESS